MKKYVAYYRVSTDKQGINGLGMEAQRCAVHTFLNGAQPIAEYQEVESGKCNQRVKLLEALTICRRHKATLVIAKLDRLSRNAAFLLNLRDSGVEFVCCDMPQADRLTVGIMAIFAQNEREQISARTRAGLAVAKSRGAVLGNPSPEASLKRATLANQQRARAYAAQMLPVVRQIEDAGVSSLQQIAVCLNARGFKTPYGKEFSAQSVKNLKAMASK